MMLRMLELEGPTSAVNLLVAIWNSCTLSSGRFISVPPTTSSLLSPPSMVMLPPRPKAPAEDTSRVLVLVGSRSEEHTSELQSHLNLVCRLLLEKKKNI